MLRAGHWPHAARTSRDALDLSNPNMQAVRVLARDVGTQRLVAFAGARASVAYGRLAWAGLTTKLYEDDEARHVEPLQKTGIEGPWRRFGLPPVQRTMQSRPRSSPWL